MSWQDPAPGEREARQRTWQVVRDAYAERIPSPRTHDKRLLVAAAIAAALVAAALSPPGHAVWGSLRNAVQEDQLVALPTSGRVLVNTEDGAWVVRRDGSKRFLSGYSDASWSPHGKFIAAARANELVAMEPNGHVHWKLARPATISTPQWSFEGFRVAYFAGTDLRVVNGDGTGDRLLTREARRGVIAWQPRTHSLAYVTRQGNIAITNVDRPVSSAHIRTRLSPRALQWTDDARLVVVGARGVAVFAQRGPQISRVGVAGRVTSAAMAPDGKRLAVVRLRAGSSSVDVEGQTVFKGAGTIADAEWSPDGRWLLLNWTGADQWVFLRAPAMRLVTVSNITATYGHGATLAGWCCP